VKRSLDIEIINIQEFQKKKKRGPSSPSLTAACEAVKAARACLSADPTATKREDTDFQELAKGPFFLVNAMK
jgi:hypothetical protein